MPEKQVPVQFAHSGRNPDESDWQPLKEHLEQVANLSKQRAEAFSAGDWGYLIGLLHDLGKYTDQFQRRIRGSNERTDHATAGAKIAALHLISLHENKTLGKNIGKVFAFAIAGHHAGLANGESEGQERSTLKQRLALSFGNEIPALNKIWQQEISLPKKLEHPQLKTHSKSNKYKNFNIMFLTRMLFSCLIDSDRIDTENYTRRLDGKSILTTNHPSIQTLQKQLNTHLSWLNEKSKPSEINILRQRILHHARELALQPRSSGLYSLTVPTGGGKTLTSLAFGLDHAAQHQMRRLIYVIPFTSIIEQTAEVFRNVLGEHKDAVLEHHSAFDRDKLPEEIKSQNQPRKADFRDKLRLSMESWDSPIIVTTAVQFFESLFSDRPSQCRKLHNIAGSVIVLDEAQTLPLKLLRPIMATIDELALNYGCSIVLCTATQPALLDGEFHNGFEDVREIAPNPRELFAQLRRTELKDIGEQSDEELTEHLRRHAQVLMIVNNRRHARKLFDAIAHEEGAFHLTTSMCAEHRSRRLDEVRARLKAELPCRLVATSLIEAGVDVDFPTVYRAEAGLDSIAQAAGRCNREGRQRPENSQVFVFRSQKWQTPPELAQLAAPMRSILRLHEGDVLAPDALKKYFSAVYYAKGAELDTPKILHSIAQTSDCDFSFQTIASQFRMIESHMLPIIVPFDSVAEANLDLLRKLPDQMSPGKIAQKLQRYIVQVPERVFLQMLKIGAIVAVNPEKFGDQFYELQASSLYDTVAGLNLTDPTSTTAESLVFA